MCFVDEARAVGRVAYAHQLHPLTTYENRIRRSAEKNTAETMTPLTISRPNPSLLASLFKTAIERQIERRRLARAIRSS